MTMIDAANFSMRAHTQVPLGHSQFHLFTYCLFGFFYIGIWEVQGCDRICGVTEPEICPITPFCKASLFYKAADSTGKQSKQAGKQL